MLSVFGLISITSPSGITNLWSWLGFEKSTQYRRPHSYLVAAFGLCGLRKSLRLQRNLGYSGVFAAVLSRYVSHCVEVRRNLYYVVMMSAQVQNQQTRPIGV